MYCSSWLLCCCFFLLVFSWCPQKSALVEKKLSTERVLAKKQTSRSTLLHSPWKEKHESSWLSVRTDIRKSFCEPMQGYERWRWLQSHGVCEYLRMNSSFSAVSTDSYQRCTCTGDEYEWWDVCLCVSVVYYRRGSESATPGSRCRAEAAVLAQVDPCCRPAERAARRACCTAGTLSSPPTT